MLNKIVKTRTSEDVTFAKIPPILYGSFKGERSYRCVKVDGDEYTFDEIHEPGVGFETLTIEKQYFDAIKDDLIIENEAI